MFKAFFVVSFLFPIIAWANFPEMLQEFMDQNFQLRIQKFEQEKAALAPQIIESSKNWVVSSSLAYDDNQLSSLSSSSQSGTKTKSLTLGIARPVSYGVEFSATQTIHSYDFSGASSSLRQALEDDNMAQSEFSLGLSLDLDGNFAGRKYWSELKSAKLGVELTTKQLEQSEELLLYSFYSTYLQVKAQLSLVHLQGEALKRAQTRENLVTRRVRDGVSEKADQLDAQIYTRQQEEALRTAQANLSEAVSAMEQALHRNLAKQDFFEIPFRAPRLVDTAAQAPSSLELQALQREGDLLKEQVRRSSMELFPALKLSAELKSNTYKMGASDAVSETFPKSDTHEKLLALALSFPWDFKPARLELAKVKISQQINAKRQEYIKRNLELQQQRYSDQISLSYNNIQSVLQNRTIAQRAVKETNHLYELGKTDLNRVIASEENLINIERTFVSYFLKYEVLCATREKDLGLLKKYLESKKEI